MNIVAIIQARMGSTRLPGKVLEKIGGYPVLLHVVHRIDSCTSLPTVVAIPDTPENDILKEWCKTWMVSVFRGPEEDVLTRYVGAAKLYDADVIVRVTADCPFIDPETIRQVANLCESGVECVSTYRVIHGLECEAYSREYLEKASERITDPVVREGMTIAEHGAKVTPEHAKDLYGWRWTLDTPEDLAFFRAVAERIDTTPPKPSVADLTTLLLKYPQLPSLNS